MRGSSELPQGMEEDAREQEAEVRPDVAGEFDDAEDEYYHLECFSDNDDYCHDDELFDMYVDEEEQVQGAQRTESFVGNVGAATSTENAGNETVGAATSTENAGNETAAVQTEVETASEPAGDITATLETPTVQTQPEFGPTATTEADTQRFFDEQNEENIHSDDENNEDIERYTFFNAEKDMMNPTFEIGLRFTNAKEFRTAVRNYCIKEGKRCKFRPSEQKRVRALCTTVGCEWNIYASVEIATKSPDLVLKAFNLTHNNCNHQWKNKLISAKWVAERFIERVRVNPKIPIKSIRQHIDEEFKSEMSRTAAYNARTIALKMIAGDYEEQYKVLWNYREEILRAHPNSTIQIEHENFRENNGQPRFTRLYMCLGQLKAGFINHCRPIIGVDGCHMKGPHRGQILSAIATDGSNGWWPIAWAVVEKEATNQWKWFFELLVEDLAIPIEGLMWTFISDRQKGLDAALGQVMPNANHRFCVQHLYCNFKKIHRGKALKDKLWAIARSTNQQQYDKACKEMEDYDKEAWRWITNGPKAEHWVKAFFPKHVKCDMLCNNICESFNAFILEVRDKPIITLVEGIRELVMKRIQFRRSYMIKQPRGTMTPKIRQIVEANVLFSRDWKPLWNGTTGYQVKGPRNEQYVVDLTRNTCSCGSWGLTGIPCVHCIAALHKKGLDPHSYVDECYSVETFCKLYDNVLMPINGQDMWPKGNGVILDAPRTYTQPGRPKKARKRQWYETEGGGRRIRRRIVIHCAMCKVVGHNRTTCPQRKRPAQTETETTATAQVQTETETETTAATQAHTGTTIEAVQEEQREGAEAQIVEQNARQKQFAPSRSRGRGTRGRGTRGRGTRGRGTRSQVQEQTTVAQSSQQQEPVEQRQGRRREHNSFAYPTVPSANERNEHDSPNVPIVAALDDDIPDLQAGRHSTAQGRGRRRNPNMEAATSRSGTTAAAHRTRGRRQSRADKTFNDFGDAWLGGGGSRNRYSYRRPQRRSR